MPVCVSCRGEYSVPAGDQQDNEVQSLEASAPSPFDELVPPQETQESEAGQGTPPSASSGPVTAYDLQDLPPFVCARCHQNNQRWHEWDTDSGAAHFGRFFLRSIPWGYLALISFLLPFLAIAADDAIKPVASVRIGVPLAILLIFVNVALLYAIRDSLWHYNALSRLGRGFRPSLVTLGVTFFVLALIFGLALVFMMEARADDPEAEPTQGLLRVLTTILLALTFVNVTLSAMFLAAHDYGRWLDREMPQPIYTQERRLLGIIQDGMLDRISQATGKGRGEVTTTIADIERVEDGGFDLAISAEVDSADEDSLKKLQNWKVSADRWGRLKTMRQEGPPQYIELPSSDNDGADEVERTADDLHKTAEEGETEAIWERDYRSRSETSVSITSSNRHWME